MIDSSSIREAATQLAREFPPTPLIFSEHFSRLTGARVHLKLENLQRTGSFKVRGALTKLRRCRDRIGPLGVVAASAGNHAQGVALAASRLGIPATVVMPERAPISKQVATRNYGGRVILAGRDVGEALVRARQLVDGGYTFVHPYDDADVVAGQGTTGLEILSQCPDVQEVWVPVGGGGLVAGIAVAVKDARPATRIVGVQSQACPSARAALRAGAPVRLSPERSIADGIAVPEVGALTYPILRDRVDELRTVGESRIAMTLVELLEKKKLLAEGAGVAALAAFLEADPERVRRRTVVVVLSGGNVDLNILDRILELGLLRTGRIVRFGIVLDDIPGALASVIAVVSGHGANILHIHHDRHNPALPVGRTRVEVEVETRGFDHAGAVVKALGESGLAPEIIAGAEPLGPGADQQPG